MKNTIKVPFREVYCWGWKTWLKATFWCHVVMRLFPRATELPSDSTVQHPF